MTLFTLILLSTLGLVSGMTVRAGLPPGVVTPAGIDAVVDGTLGPRISIAVSSIVDEQDPAVAACGGYITW